MFRRLLTLTPNIRSTYTRGMIYRSFPNKYTPTSVNPYTYSECNHNEDLELLRLELLNIIDLKYSHINERLNNEIKMRLQGEIKYDSNETGLLKKILDNDSLKHDILDAINKARK
jgi:hypothetical protein